MKQVRSAALLVVSVTAWSSTLGAQNGSDEASAMFRGGPAHTGVYEHAVSGRALVGLQ